jgi:hypothetical protein
MTHFSQTFLHLITEMALVSPQNLQLGTNFVEDDAIMVHIYHETITTFNVKETAQLDR